MAENEVGPSKSNVVYKFVKLLLHIEEKTGIEYIYSTGLILGWFGDIRNKQKIYYCAEHLSRTISI